MSMTVTLPDELAGRLTRLAVEGGVSVDEVVVRVLSEHLPETTTVGMRRLAFAGIGSSRSGRTAAYADKTLAEGFGRDVTHGD